MKKFLTKFLCLLLVACACLAFVACGNSAIVSLSDIDKHDEEWANQRLAGVPYKDVASVWQPGEYIPNELAFTWITERYTVINLFCTVDSGELVIDYATVAHKAKTIPSFESIKANGLNDSLCGYTIAELTAAWGNGKADQLNKSHIWLLGDDNCIRVWTMPENAEIVKTAKIQKISQYGSIYDLSEAVEGGFITAEECNTIIAEPKEYEISAELEWQIKQTFAYKLINEGRYESAEHPICADTIHIRSVLYAGEQGVVVIMDYAYVIYIPELRPNTVWFFRGETND